ncbi:MAG: hypothetical protein NVSMB14_09850 [Isosphaeraceae bacterium]
MTSLVKQIDAKIAKNRSLKSYVVFLSDDADKTADTLKAMAKDAGIKNVPLCVIESPSGPPAYKIAEDAEVTVMMWNQHEVKANHAFAKGELSADDVKAVVADLSKILAK